MALVLAIFILPTLAIAWVIPEKNISFTAGVMQAFNSLFAHFGIKFAVPLVAIALAIGALAGMMAWLDGPSEGLLRIGREQGFLPPFFQKVNRKGIEMRILTGQAIVITVIALLYALMPDVSRAYWIFAVMATQVYLIMYVLMFIAAVRLRRTQPDHPRGYRAPAFRLLCVVGAVSSVDRSGHRLHRPVAVRPLESAALRTPHPRRDTRDRDRPAAAHGSASQARVEGRRPRANPRALTSGTRKLPDEHARTSG